jgi:hypothetical protein
MPDSEDEPSPSDEAVTIPTPSKFETPLEELEEMPELPPGYALVATVQIIVVKYFRALTAERKIVSYDQILTLKKMLKHREVLSIKLSLIAEIPPAPKVPVIEEADEKPDADD